MMWLGETCASKSCNHCRRVGNVAETRSQNTAIQDCLLEDGPWVLLGPAKAYVTTTEGGAVVNQQMQVLEPNGSIIPGLYAVGQNSLVGMILWSHGPHIAWAMTSGRLAGVAVMTQQWPEFAARDFPECGNSTDAGLKLLRAV